MAINRIEIEQVAPAEVFELLATPEAYAEWVVGPSYTDPVDPRWPAPGAVFRHRTGVPPLTVADVTSVVSVDPPQRIRLQARMRRLLVATIDIEVSATGSGSLVVLDHRIVGGIASYLPRRLTDAAIRPRNQASLERLAGLARRLSPARPAV